IPLPGAIPLHLAFSPGGDALAAACGDTLVRLVAPRSSEVRALRGHTATVSWVGFVPGTSLLASASGDGTVRIWNGDSLAPLAVRRGHGGPIVDAAVAPDGASLASVGMDGRVAIWNLAREARPARDVLSWIRCRVPRELRDGRIAPRARPPGCSEPRQPR